MNTFNNILDTIGNSPLIKLGNLLPEKKLNLFGKLELANPSGSLKDRTAIKIIDKAISSGKLNKGDMVIESSSGNMALSLAQTCLIYDLKLTVVVDPKLNNHTKKLLKIYGAKLEQIQTPHLKSGYLGARLKRVNELLSENPNSFWPNQYANENVLLAHQNTCEEIFTVLDNCVDYIFIATSTGGTLMNFANYIHNRGLPTQLIAVDAEGSVLFGGTSNDRLIPGHGSSIPSQLIDHEKIMDYIKISDLDCIKGCWNLLKKEGVLCGGSTGGVIGAIKKYAGKIPVGSNCVIFLSDRGDRYLNTIYNHEWIARNFPDFKLNELAG